MSDGAEVGVKLGMAAVALTGLFFVHTCATKDVEAQGSKIDSLLNDLKTEQFSAGSWRSSKMPDAEAAIKLETESYFINFIPHSKEDPNGTIIVFDKSSAEGTKYAKISSTGKVVEGSAVVAKSGLTELRAKYPQSLDGVPSSVERVGSN